MSGDAKRQQQAAENRRRHAGEAAADLIVRVVAAGDRSCWSCDFLDRGFCRHWKEQVPAESLEQGCVHVQVHGAPF